MYNSSIFHILFFFFFQAEDGIRDLTVTGVQTCALPISAGRAGGAAESHRDDGAGRGLSRGTGGRLLEGPETDRGAVAGGPSPHARDENRPAPTTPDRPGGRAGGGPGAGRGRLGVTGSNHSRD